MQNGGDLKRVMIESELSRREASESESVVDLRWKSDREHTEVVFDTKSRR